MVLTDQSPGVREFEDGATVSSGNTKLLLNYTKNDPRVATLVVNLYNQAGQVVGSQSIDVSGQGIGTSADYQVTLGNGLAPASVTADGEFTNTIPAGQSSTLTAPADHYLVITGATPDIDIQVSGISWPFNKDIVVRPGVSVTLVNNGTVDVTVTVRQIPQTEITESSFTVEILEQDSGGTTIYQYSATINEIGPLNITLGQEGQVTLKVVG